MFKNHKHGLIIIFFLFFTSASCHADVYQSFFCTEEEADNTAATYGLIYLGPVIPPDNTTFPMQYHPCIEGKEYKLTGDNYEFFTPVDDKVCDEACAAWLGTFACDFGCDVTDPPPVDIVDPVFVHLAGLAGCLIGFLFGLAFILGSYF